MKRLAVLCMLALVCATATPVQAAGRGGLMGFIAGCCFGIRAGGDYNEGKEIHWREWIRIIPVVGLIIGIWDGIECYNGKTGADYAAQYGSQFY